MIPVWPEELPERVLVDGFQSGPAGSRLRTSMETGPAKQRRRGPKVASQTSAIYANSDERARFERFWDEEVSGGTRPFLIRAPLVDGRTLATETGGLLLDDDGVELVIESWNLVQFGQTDPVYTALGGLDYRIQFELVLLP